MIKRGLARPHAVVAERALVLTVLGWCLALPVHAGTITYTYDVHGRLSSVSAPHGLDQSTTNTTYDATDNRANVTNSYADHTPPNSPTGLTAAAVSYNSVQLNWSPSIDVGGGPVSYYKVYRGGAFLASASAPPLNDQSVSGNTTYSYTVSAVDPSGNESAQSAAATTTTPPPPDATPPSAPTGLQGSAVSGTQVNLTWTGSTDTGGSGLAGYEIFRNNGSTPIGTSTVPSFSDGSLSPGNTYTYTVRAYDGAGNRSAMSNPISVTTPDTIPPSVPTNLQGTAVSGTQINLTWTASTDTGGSGLAGYKIFRNSAQIGTSTVASYSDAGLAAYTSYTYTVLAYDGAGNQSAQSGAVTVRTVDSIPPSAPGNPTFSAITTNSATASWTSASDNVGVTNYRYSLNGGASWTAVGNTTTASLTGLTIGTSYTMYVEAEDAAGNWGPASSASFSTSAYYTENFSVSAGSNVVYNYNNYPYVTVDSTDSGYLQSGWGSLTPNTTNNGLTIWELNTHSDYTTGQTWTALEINGFGVNPGAGWLGSISVPGIGTLTGTSASFGCSGSTCTWNWVNAQTVGSGTVTIIHR